jgi:phosphate starvation-inducible protein PhoH and related proteins
MPVTASAQSSLREFDLEPSDNARLANLCGPLDENLRLLESRLEVQIRRRGDNFRVTGVQAESAEDTLRELFDLTKSEEVTPERVHLTLRERESGRLPPDASQIEQGVRVPRGGIRARGNHQRDYLSHIRLQDLTFGIGPAGTGKTYLAVACAVEALQSDKVRRIILVRPAVEAGERLGFLPGDLREKVDPYLRPLYDALYDMLPGEQVMKRLASGEIEIAPLAFMRGRTLANAFVILDEAQNTTPMQMKMFLTRLGENARMAVTGDLSQIDLPGGAQCGLRDALDTLEGVDGIAVIEFSDTDVVRHALVARIVRAYDQRERKRQTAAKAKKS